MLNAAHLAQVFEAIEEAAFDGAEAAIQGGGDFLERVVDVKTEVNNLALFVGQVVQVLLEIMGTVNRFAFSGRRRLGVDDVFAGVGGEGNKRFATKHFLVAMEHDAAKPRKQTAAAIKPAERLP